MGFLGALGDALSSQFGLVTNNTSTLDAVNVFDGQNTKYGALGDFASQIDQSAERRYLEEGYLRIDPYETDPRQFEVMWQQPSATILVKKKMFSSIAENYRPDFMDADETLYYKSMCLLFQNKCNQIAALEKLSKIQQVTSAVGSISGQIVPIIITLADQINNGYATGGGVGVNGPSSLFTTSLPFSTQDATSFFQTVDRLRTLVAYNQTAQYTTWLTDPTDLYQSVFGPGSGVIEITNFTSINTTASVDINQPGNFSFSISDPYQSMLITDYDIELALSDATNSNYTNPAITLGIQSANQTITQQQNMLNSARSGRNASPISFNVQPNTIVGAPVTVIIDRLGLEIPFTYDALGSLIGLGSAVTVPPDYLRGGALAGYDGLDTGTLPIGPDNNIKPLFGSSELSIFSAIITAIFQQLTTLQNNSQNYVVQNQYTNYARRKLRFNFSGKLIIQPMDTVHIYMTTKSQYDNKILAGLQQMFSGFGTLENVEGNINTVVGSIGTLLDPSGGIQLQAEKAIYVGPDFPNYLWSLMRPQFVTEIEGTHVMAGVINSAVDNWSKDGKFTMNISGDDNTVYFKQGKINFKPGVDAFNGMIFDPLTPFISNWDSFTGNATSAVTAQNASNSPQLLDENMTLIGDTPSTSLVKFKQGAHFGEKVTQGNFIQDQIINPTTGKLTQTMYAPDGLVYKWKQGIGIFARSGTTSTIDTASMVGTPSIYNEPFAGLDVMNVLSLLIAGVPYNYATYIKGTSSIGNFGGDPNSKQSGTKTFLDSLRNDLLKTNLLWGNFVPFKSLVMNQAAVSLAMQAQLSVNNISSDLDKKLNQLSVLNSQAAALGAVNALPQPTNPQANPDATNQSQSSNVKTQIQQLQSSINDAINDLQTAQTAAAAQVTMTPAYVTSGTGSTSTEAYDPTVQQTIRQEVNYLTRRMSYDVRANVDKNLFIVDDYYDTDYDIAAFNTSLDTIKLQSNDFTNVLDKIKHVADLLNLEVFADSQGHIRVRPPQYNKMPSSVFYRMLYLQQTQGIQVFPQFLVNLFTNQINSLGKQISVIEDNIRLLCAILGQYPSLDNTGDATATAFISGQNSTSGMSGTFNFVSDPTGGISDYTYLIQQANQEESTGVIDQSLGAYGTIESSAISTVQLFSNSQRYSVLLAALSAQANTGAGCNINSAPSTSIFQNSVVQSLIYRIQTNSGQAISSKDYLTSAGPNQPTEIDTGQTIDIFKVTKDLTTFINQWQTQVNVFYHAIKNAAEFESLDNDNSTTNSIGIPGVFGNGQIPEVYEHMIEDETFDDYGLGSGSRYVIHANQITNLSIHEEPPPWTTVEVQGALSPMYDPASGGGGAAGFFQLPSGGNGMVSAIAIDYDMWRFYGFKQPHSIPVPFLKDPVSQCGPYAAMVLTRNRSNILQGTCTISGNEFMQVGEVVYLEDRNLLFYITSVRHNYTEGSSFTTTLDLRYGHSIGDYIPTYLDTIGKIIFKNQPSVDVVIQRQDSSNNEKNLGIVQLDGQNPTADVLYTGDEDDNINAYSGTNQTVLDNVLYQAANIINTNGAYGNNVTASVEIRVYYDNNNSPSGNLGSAAQEVMDYLTSGSSGPQQSPGIGASLSSGAGGGVGSTVALPSSSVSIVAISMDDDTDTRSPSQQALSAARTQVAVTSVNSGVPPVYDYSDNGADDNDDDDISADNTDLRTALYSYIIDIWLTFTSVPSTVASDSTYNPVDAGS